jgi:uncharacterized membrane protein YjgN (DUF898 family)
LEELNTKEQNVEMLQNEVDTLKDKASKKREYDFKYFEFKGNASEYFRIWIVNIALTILTLGIYSAWAKVRSNRYMYANTYLNGSNFEYNADPIKILTGRIIVVSLYALFVLFSQYLMMFKIAGGIAIVALLAMPWLVRQAVSFKLRNTSYRNVPFRYEGKISSFYGFFILHIFLNIITLMLIFPYSYVKFKKLIIDNAHYGDGEFSFAGKTGDAYAIYIQIFVWSSLFITAIFMVFGLVSTGVASVFGDFFSTLDEMSIDSELIAVFIGAGVFLIYVPFIFWNKGFSDGYFSNFVRNVTTLNASPLKGEMKPFKLGVISATNALAIFFSLGLLYPWAQIRYLKYKLEHTAFACEDYAQFESHGYVSGSTVGEEMVDYFDIDIGL